MLDGAGYTLSGPYNGTAVDVWLIGEGPNQLPNGTLAQYIIGIDLASASVDGVTIENLNVKNFSIGMYVWTKNNTVTGNAGSNETVTKNYIADNQRGSFLASTTKETSFPQTL